MKLSEAIRLGAMNHPQAFGAFSKTRRVPGWRGWLLGRTELTTCAVGAAVDAARIGTKPFIAPVDYDSWRGSKVKKGEVVQVLDIPSAWEPIWCEFRPCPMDCCASLVIEAVSGLIPHLNDVHGWSRERIADWVESIEREHEPSPAQAGVIEDTGSDYGRTTRLVMVPKEPRA